MIEGLFLFVIYACRPTQPGCARAGGGDPTGIGLVLRTDPIEHAECEARFRAFVTRMDAHPEWHGFFYGRCKRADVDV